MILLKKQKAKKVKPRGSKKRRARFEKESTPKQGEPEVLSNTDIEVVMEKDSNQGDKITDLLEE